MVGKMPSEPNTNELVRSEAIQPLWITDFSVFQIRDYEKCNDYLATLETEHVIEAN